MNKDNIFNGYYLKYYITSNLLRNIKLILFNNIKAELYLYNKNDKYILVEETNLNENNPFYLPTGMFSNFNFNLKCNLEDNDKIYEHKFISNNYNIPIVLNSFQKEIFNVYNNYSNLSKNKPQHITFNLPCGFGKTVLTTYLSLIYGFKTFVIINRKILMPQWSKIFRLAGLNVYCSYFGIKSLLNKLSLNIDENDLNDESEYIINVEDSEEIIKDMKIQSKSDLDIKNMDVLIFPDKHLKNKEFSKYLSDNFSICIIDETHTYNLMNSSYLCYFLSHYYIKYVFSLSATPKINNRLFFGYEISLNPVSYSKYITSQNIEKKYIEVIKLTSSIIQITPDIRFYLSSYNKKELTNNKLGLITKLNYFNHLLRLDTYRNNFIIENIVNNYTNTTKAIAIFSLLEHIDYFYNILKNKINNVFKISSENAIKTKNLFEPLDNFLVLATDKMLSVGYDLSSLNTIHIISGINNETNLIQTSGRLERKDKNRNKVIKTIFSYNYISYKDSNIINKFKSLIHNYSKILQEHDWDYSIMETI